MLCVVSGLLLCFFFFKQKTAYEMRISDWSSDVCSSDLLECQEYSAVESEHQCGGQTAEQCVRVEQIEESRLDLLVGVDRHAPNDVRESHAPEIGSASCRERVCQYV